MAMTILTPKIEGSQAQTWRTSLLEVFLFWWVQNGNQMLAWDSIAYDFAGAYVTPGMNAGQPFGSSHSHSKENRLDSNPFELL